MTRAKNSVLALAAAVAFLAAAPLAAGPASANQLDLSTVKCKEFIESGKDNIGLILMWLAGYYADEDDPPIVDFDKMAENGQKLGEYCAKNPGHSVITAAEEIMGK